MTCLTRSSSGIPYPWWLSKVPSVPSELSHNLPVKMYLKMCVWDWRRKSEKKRKRRKFVCERVFATLKEYLKVNLQVGKFDISCEPDLKQMRNESHRPHDRTEWGVPNGITSINDWIVSAELPVWQNGNGIKTRITDDSIWIVWIAIDTFIERKRKRVSENIDKINKLLSSKMLLWICVWESVL